MRAAAVAGATLLVAACGSGRPAAGQAPRAPQTVASEPDSGGISASVNNDIDVVNARIPAPPAGAATAQLEVTLAGTSPAGPDTLRAASSPAAHAVEFTGNGHPVAAITVPFASGDVSVSTGPPNPDRILLTGLRRTLRPGQDVTVTLTFARAGRATLRVPVVPAVP